MSDFASPRRSHRDHSQRLHYRNQLGGPGVEDKVRYVAPGPREGALPYPGSARAAYFDDTKKRIVAQTKARGDTMALA